MYTVDKNSWHYNLVYNLVGRERYIPTNLCPYMRKLMWAMVKAFVKYVVMFMAGVAVVSVVLAPPLYWANHFFHFLPASWLPADKNQISVFQLLVIIGMAVYTVATAMFGLVLPGKYVWDNLADYRFRRHLASENLPPPPPKPPGLFRTYYNTWKTKTCIQLEFVDPSEAKA